MQLQRSIKARSVASAVTAAFIALTSVQFLQAELVLRLDAKDTSKLTLSTDVTSSTINVGGFPFPDPRAAGLKFVEGWGQSYGATANPTFSPVFTPLPDVNNLLRPTYDPHGLGPGLPTVNFDSNPSSVLSQGQYLTAALDNLIYSDKYSIFFVAQAPGDSRAQYAFAQDLDFRMEGFAVGQSANNRWLARINGNAGSTTPTITNATGGAGNMAAAVRSLVSNGTSVDFDTTDNTGATVTLTTTPAAPKNANILSGGDFSIGNRGGSVTSSSAPFNGKIAEIAIFNTLLDDTQQTAINAYLANKWLGAPAPTPTQSSVALALLQQPAATVGAKQLVRYQFNPTNPDASTKSILTPEIVAAGVAATDLGTGIAPVGGNLPAGISNSTVGISANSAFLDATGVNWNATTEQSPATGNPNYLTFTITPDAGKQIDPYQLAFTLARGTGATPDDIRNAVNSYGVWINSGNGFVKAGGQVSVAPPLGSTDVLDTFFDTYTVDLSSLAAFKQATEVRLYFWHNGPQTNTSTTEWRARVDNLRLRGDIQALSAGVAGDYNNNGIVDAGDYVVWRDNVNTNNVLPNDLIGGTIGASQYDQWRSHFGMSAGSGSGLDSVAAPEPSSIALVIYVAQATLLARKRRR